MTGHFHLSNANSSLYISSQKSLAIIASDSKIYIKVMFLRQIFRDHDIVIFTRKKKIFPEYVCEIKYLQGTSKGGVKWKVVDKKNLELS